MKLEDRPRWVWEDPPCITYTEDRLHGSRVRGGCLFHQTTGPDRVTVDEALADNTKHLQLEWQKHQTLHR